ncbi:MAG: hypothetical protein J7K63_02605 [Candidatus Marinimicrobia bacterium]|nr:hypothetical protein [Candidatus Neomarinimicrobiota bacterium]
MFKHRILQIFILLILPFLAFGTGFQLLEEQGRITLSWEGNQEDLASDSRTTTLDVNGYWVPAAVFLFHGNPHSISIQTEIPEEKKLTLETPFIPVREKATGAEREITENNPKKNIKNPWEIKPIPGGGFSLTVYPLIPVSATTARQIKRLTLTLTDGSGELAPYTEKVRRSRPVLKKSQNPLINGPFANVRVSKPGMVRIDGWMLSDAGVDIRNIRPDRIQVFHHGEEQPARVISRSPERLASDDQILVWLDSLANPYGTYRHNPHSPYDVLQLTWNRAKGLRFTEESGEVTGNADYHPESFTGITHLERAEYWEKLSKVHQDEMSEVSDHWFFSNRIIAGTSDTFLIQLDHPKQNSERQVKVRLKFQGITYGAPRHELTVLLNNRFLAVDSWEGQKEKIVSSEGQNFSHGHLRNGDNQLTVVMSGDPTIDRLYDMVLLDWAEIEYERYFRASGDKLRFQTPVETGPGEYLYELNGFSTPDVMILKNDRFWLRDYVVYYDAKYRGYSVLFQDESLTGREVYTAVGPEGLVPADTVIYRDPAEDTFTGAEGDYIIITHPDFLEDLEDFINLQTERGFTPVVVDVTRLYDRYAWGNRTPYAIRDYLKEAWDTWSIRPCYALLVGDAGSTGRATKKEGMFIPTQFFQTYKWGSSITDAWYGDVDEDLYQEIIIGRLPVRETEQLANALAKLRVWHEKPVVDSWLNRIVMIAGYEDEFKQQTETIISRQIPDGVQIDRLYINPGAETGPFYGTTATLSDFINAGRPLVNFRGHGGGAVWADRSLFTLDDVEGLENIEKPCIITSFTCFTAAFETERGLGEGLTRLPGGSVGFLGSSGLGWVVNDYLMLQAIYRYLFEEGVSFGRAVQRGKLQYVSTTGWATHTKTGFYQYNILGDPSILLPFEDAKNTLKITPPDAAPGESITLEIPGFSAPSATLDLTFRGSRDTKHPIMQNRPLKPASGSQLTITLPDTIHAEKGDVTVFYWNETEGTYRAGHAPLSFGASVIYNPVFVAGPPEIGGKVAVQVKVLDSQGVDSVLIRWQEGSEELLTAKGNDIYESRPLLWDSPAGKTFTIRVVDGPGQETRSESFTLKPLPGANLAIYSVTPTAAGLSLSLGSTVDDEISVRAQCTIFEQAAQTDTLHLIKGVENYIPDWVLPYGEMTATLEIYPLDYRETDSTDNVWSDTLVNYWLKADEQGFSAYPQGFSPGHPWFRKINLSVENGPVVAGITSVDTLFDLSGAGAEMDTLQALFLDFESPNVTYTVTCPGGTDTTRIPAVYNPESGRLLSLIPVENGYRGTMSGYLLRVCPLDIRGPDIEITVNSREILPGSYVSGGARFSAIITDEKMVHPDPLTWGVWLDGEKLTAGAVKWVLDPSGRRLGLNFSPDFTPDKTHTLAVRAMDGMGNETRSPEYELFTAGSARIIDYGCFPNPFGARTHIIYELTSQFDEVFIDIYTLSGRRILRIDRFNAETDLPLNDVGYHEVPWYGRDKDDEFVANGVYFYRIHGIISAERFSARGKVVKLK